MPSKKSKLALAVALTACLAAMLMALAGCGSNASNNTATNDTNFNVSEKEYTHVEDPEAHYILVIGNDEWENYYETDRSDLMMIMRVDCKQGTISLVNIPRDTKYTWDDGSVSKANEVYAREGAQGALKAACQITGLNITDYIDIGFDGLSNIVDTLGGVSINLPYTITYNFYTKDFPDETYNAGEQMLTGWQAMVISRARTGYKTYGLGQDMMRQVVNRQMMTNLIKAALTDKAKALELMISLLPNVDTNISVEDMSTWVKQLLAFDKITVYGNSGPADGAIDGDSGLWLCYPEPESWAALAAALESGSDITAVDANTSTVESDIAPIRSTTVIELH